MRKFCNAITIQIIHYNQGAILLCLTKPVDSIEFHRKQCHMHNTSIKSTSRPAYVHHQRFPNDNKRQCEKNALGNSLFNAQAEPTTQMWARGKRQNTKKNLTAVWSRVRHKIYSLISFCWEFHFDFQTTAVMLWLEWILNVWRARIAVRIYRYIRPLLNGTRRELRTRLNFTQRTE